MTRRVEDGRNGSRSVAWVLLVGLVLLGVWARFHNLSNIGLEGSDTVYYTSLAERWSPGRLNRKS